MRVRAAIATTVCLIFCVCGAPASAQYTVPPQWIWFDEGNPAASAPAGKVWFRTEVRADEPSTGAVNIACDDDFVLWVNGKKIGEGGGRKAFRFNLSGIVGRGANIFAVEATNREGRAGLYVDGEVRGQSGVKFPCATGAVWRATRRPPEGDAWLNPKFDDASWKPAKELGAHADSPWQEIAFTGGALDRFQVPEGFEIRQIGAPSLAGSLVAMTWGNRGRLLVSQERGPILALSDENGDGDYDKAVEFSTEMKNCQGLCQVFDDLYAVGEGPQGTGIYRLPDRNHDDRADEVVWLATPKGNISEHGPHDIVFGPDGWLYHNLGNHAWITTPPESTTPCRNAEEGYLLDPRFEDAGGHAVGIKAPGGTIWRFSPDGKKWWMETNGFRNHYDIAFNSQGDLFSFDSDMEWDVGLPWYRPVRINHCIPGAEFGWRSGAATWPAYNFDSLPGTIDVGRGSPTGVVFYEHTRFPAKYRGALLSCDWSMGRIIAAFLKPQGATFEGTGEDLVTGNPLNVSDIEVDRDGSVVFCTGGRKTEGGIYRVSYRGTGDKAAIPRAESIEDALAMPQLQSAWARELVSGIKTRLGNRWESELAAKVQRGTPSQKVRALSLLAQFGPRPTAALLIEAAKDEAPTVRAFAAWLLGDQPGTATSNALSRLLADSNPTVQRRACEAFVRSGLEPPTDPLLKLLSSDDRWLRFAARLALERIPVGKWRSAVLASTQPDVVLCGLLALHRSGAEGGPPDAALNKVAELLEKIPGATRQRVDALRMAQLALLAGAKGPTADKVGADLLAQFRSDYANASRDETTQAVAIESTRIIAFLQVPGAVEPLVQALEQSRVPILQMHYLLCLQHCRQGWNAALKERVLNWYETTHDWEGGNSLQGYLRNIVGAWLVHFSPVERKQMLETWTRRPFATRAVVNNSLPEEIADYDQVMPKLLAELAMHPEQKELAAITVEALGKSTSPQSQGLLRKMFDDEADQRDQIARGLAKHPTPENVPYLLRSLLTADIITTQICLQAIAASDFQPTKPSEYRIVLQGGLKLGMRGGLLAANVMKKWTRSDHNAGTDFALALAHYQAWYRDHFPDAPPPELAQDDAGKTKYTFQQLLDFLEKDPRGSQGDVTRGRQVFAKANCLKCHRFLKEGEGVGPDLTTVRRRFQRKEIIESLVYPSQVISDQYSAVTIATVDGLVYTGMLLPNPGSDQVKLLLSDATRIEIPKNKIEEQTRAKTSVMPEALLKDLTLPEIADLFAFLETSRNNPEPAK